jgi:hypothetical protein
MFETLGADKVDVQPAYFQAVLRIGALERIDKQNIEVT